MNTVKQVVVLARVHQRNRTDGIYRDVETCVMRNGLPRLWRLRTSTVCHPEDGDPGG